MFEALSAAVEELDVPLHREALRDLAGIAGRLQAKLAGAVGAYEAAGLHEVDGSLSMVAWLRHETSATTRAAAALTRRGRLLGACPVLADAVVSGRLGDGQLEAIVATVGRHRDRFAHDEATLVPLFEGADVDATAAAMRRWRATADAVDEGPEPPGGDGEVHLSGGLQGRGELRGTLSPDLYAQLEAALRVADSGDRDLPLARRRAEALGVVARHFLDHQRVKPGGRHRPHLNVLFSYEEWAAGLGGTYLDTGGAVSPRELGVLVCDSALHRLLVDGASAILDYGRATRTVPVDLYNALVARDQGCRWPGCDRPASWCDAHHVDHWHTGGRTAIDALVLACRRHHRLSHSPGWSVKLLPDGTFEVTHPDGRTERTEPRGPIPPERRRRGDGGRARRAEAQRPLA